MIRPFTIAIDGPSASGKGTLAKKLADKFEVPFLNTGAIYRCVAHRIINQKIDPNNFDSQISALTSNITENELDNNALFTEEVGYIASVTSQNKSLRKALFDFQINFVEIGRNNNGGVVLDGRDTTTIICPKAEYKFFVTCDVEIRAKRRYDQLVKKGDDVNYEEILNQLKKRDKNDFNRKDSPLKATEDAIVIDNSTLTINEGFELMLKYLN